MNVLVVGNGGREHAFLWKLRRDDPDIDLFFTGRNAGAAEIATPLDLPVEDPGALAAGARDASIDFTIVGPEVPLAAGVVDAFRAAGLGIFGPERAGARLEASKAFAKRVMASASIPTASFRVFEAREPAAAYAAEIGPPCVVKASGLAAGKGALVCATEDEIDAALTACFDDRAFGAAGDRVVIEACLEGEEVSMIALTDGDTLLPLVPSQDHKRAEDDDRGLNTGGMGAYAPTTLLAEGDRDAILETIFRPLLAALEADGVRFAGCLYAGLMLTEDGPQVLEWNVRFGDPETQAILPLIESPLLPLLMAATPGGDLGAHRIAWRDGACVTVVAASEGYPGSYETGAPIGIPSDLAAPGAFDETGVVVFHAGTRRDGDRLVTAGGRVLNVTAIGGDVADARDRAYAALDRIESQMLRWRSDIAWREMARSGAA